MQPTFHRRAWLGLAATATVPLAASAAGRAAPPTWRFCFNTATIMGQKVPLPETIDLVAQAGYQGIEPWLREIDDYVKAGGALADLRKRLVDRGLTLVSAIGFAEWIVDDPAKRRQGLEEAKRGMDQLQQLGGQRLAAPPTGATNQTGMNLLAAAERYRALLELGDRMGIVPMVEVWGFSKTLSRLGETALVAMESGHPKACILPDIYHLYKGGSDFTGLGLLSAMAVPVLHMNDYPADFPRDKIADKDRIYPGDGVAPIREVLVALTQKGTLPWLSLELFNRDYWKQEPAQVAKTGLAKMRSVADAALAAVRPA